MRLYPLEVEAGLAGRVGQRLHAAMEPESGTVECDGLDADRIRRLGDALADDHRGCLVAAILQILAHIRLERRCAREHLVARRRDELRVDVAVRAADRQPRRTLLGDTHPGFAGAPDSSLFLGLHRSFLVFAAWNRLAPPAIPGKHAGR